MECFKHTWQERRESYCKDCHIQSLEQELEFYKNALYDVSKRNYVEVSSTSDWYE